MGRPALQRLLTEPPTATGVRWGGRYGTCAESTADRCEQVRQGDSYVVDPTVGLASLAALCAVATAPDTTLLWAIEGWVTWAGRHSSGS